MKKISFSLITLLILASCTENHYHDGKYKGTIADLNNVYNSQEKLLTIDGNETWLLKNNLDARN